MSKALMKAAEEARDIFQRVLYNDAGTDEHAEPVTEIGEVTAALDRALAEP
ncbi:unnamed protein product, partial [marine sediment metagenome]